MCETQWKESNHLRCTHFSAVLPVGHYFLFKIASLNPRPRGRARRGGPVKRAVQLFLVVSPKGSLCPSGAVGTGRFLKQGMPQYGQERHLFFFRGKNKNKKQKTPKVTWPN